MARAATRGRTAAGPSNQADSADRSAETRRRSLRGFLASAAAGALGVAPHVLHHVGPIAGAALLAGVSGKLLFGAIGFVLMIPMLRRMHRHTGSWRAPALALVTFMTIFVISTLLIGPLIAGGGESGGAGESAPTPEEHEQHHE